MQTQKSVQKLLHTLSLLISLSLIHTTNAQADALFTDGVPEIKVTPLAEPVVMPRLTDLARELSPSVVNISVESAGGEASAEGDPASKDESASPQKSLGSGFIIQEDGFIVTSNHVIDKSDSVLVRLLDDKTDYPAKIIGKDNKTDIALLKIDTGKKLRPVYIGDSDSLEVGEWVIAIGNQFQLGQTVTAGIVSAKSRRVPAGASGVYDAFIQTDASINPGSSGGPLFNSRGQVVGINTAIFSPGRAQFGGTGFNIGIGFAIPINMARAILLQLKASGKVTRGLLGVLIQRVDPDVAKILNLGSPDGALVSDVIKGSPAEQAGFKRRDVIVSFNGQKVNEHDELPSLVANTAVGTTVPMEFIREGKLSKVSVTISQLKDSGTVKKGDTEKPDALGLTVESISTELARSLDLDPPIGVTITKVDPGSIGEKAGLLRGDVIDEIDGRHFKSGDDFREFVKREFSEGSLTKEKLFLALIRRREGVRYAVIKRTVLPSKTKPMVDSSNDDDDE